LVKIAPSRAPSLAESFQKNLAAKSGAAAPETTANTAQDQSKVTVYGTVFVTNKYFYENPDSVTLASLQAGRLEERASNPQGALTEREKDLLQSFKSSTAKFPVLLEGTKHQPSNRPLSNVEVKIQGKDKDQHTVDVTSTFTSSFGVYKVSVPPGDYIVSVNTENFSASEPVSLAPTDTSVRQDLQVIVKPLGEFSRAIVGFEQAGASSAKSAQRYFFDLTLSAPLPFQKRIDPYFGPRARAWGTVRITSVPQQISSSVATFAAGFGTEVGKLRVNEVAQAAEFLGGFEYRLFSGKRVLSPFGSFDNSTTNKFTLSFMAGGGAITPLNPRDTLEVFKVTPGAPGLPPAAIGKDFVAFVSPDRDRFFRQYYAGLRFQTYYFSSINEDIPLNRYPATLDITFGQNESLTGGRLRGGVLRLEGFYPLPYDKLKFINLFGTAMMKLSRTRISDPLILAPATVDVVSSPNTAIITVPQINRDYYRVGVGIDFVALIKSLGLGQKPK
jgi:hypothetical protein